jgi:NodT family efflux transporter outer membrane factor (OMF) lipoprotein
MTRSNGELDVYGIIRGSGLAALSTLLHACTLAPEPTREEIQSQVLSGMHTPEGWRAPGALPGSVADGWLEDFDDMQLQALVQEALARNADLLLAAARVERAAAMVRAASGELYPSVTAAGRAGDDSGGDTGLEGVLLTASWELDVWGRVRYGVRGAKDEHAATAADFAYARESLVALVTKSWILAIEATLQRELIGEMVKASAALLDAAQERERVGAGSELDVVSARVSLQTYQDSLVQVELSRQQALRSLELLLGRYPSAEIGSADRLPALSPGVQAGVPSELLERRPDVIAAQRRVSVAFNLAQQAKVARLPSLTLTGGGSDVSSDLFVLQDRDNPVWSLGGRILAPLFTGGTLRAQTEIRTAEQKQAMAAYAQVALSAFNDVENALAGELAMQRRESVLSVAVTDAERALGLSQTRYRIGSGDLRDVQQQQLAFQSARMNLLRVQSERRIQRINLHLALGGDFEPST